MSDRSNTGKPAATTPAEHHAQTVVDQTRTNKGAAPKTDPRWRSSSGRHRSSRRGVCQLVDYHWGKYATRADLSEIGSREGVFLHPAPCPAPAPPASPAAIPSVKPGLRTAFLSLTAFRLARYARPVPPGADRRHRHRREIAGRCAQPLQLDGRARTLAWAIPRRAAATKSGSRPEMGAIAAEGTRHPNEAIAAPRDAVGWSHIV